MNPKMLLLAKEKIVSLSELQKNPSKALNAPIVRIVKNGKEMGIYFDIEEYEDMMEDELELTDKFKKELEESIRQSKKGEVFPIEELFKKYKK